MTELPKPTPIVFCGTCMDVTVLEHDKSGTWCSQCFKALHLLSKLQVSHSAA